MRKYSFLLFLGLISISLPYASNAQTDTTGTDAKGDSIIQYLTPLEYAFMMHEETKFMLRVPVVGVGAEVEVLPYFTLLGQFYFRDNRMFHDYAYTLHAEMRYFYGSKKKGVRNMSGNYFAIGYENPTLLIEFQKSGFYYGRWGIQRRFLGYGLIDMGINAGFSSGKEYSPDKGTTHVRNGLFIQSTAQVGLGFVFGKQKTLDRDKLCPVLKCYESETFLLKIKTNSLVSLHAEKDKYNNERHEIHIEPKIAIEQKVLDLPISIGGDLGLNYTWWDLGQHTGSNITDTGFLIGRIQTRFYYNLKNRIRKGKTGNSLSANYLSAGIYQSAWLSSNSSVDYDYGYTLTTGIQRTFSEHFYFDVELGVQLGSYPISSIYEQWVYSDIQLGIKF